MQLSTSRDDSNTGVATSPYATQTPLQSGMDTPTTARLMSHNVSYEELVQLVIRLKAETAVLREQKQDLQRRCADQEAAIEKLTSLGQDGGNDDATQYAMAMLQTENMALLRRLNAYRKQICMLRAAYEESNPSGLATTTSDGLWSVPNSARGRPPLSSHNLDSARKQHNFSTSVGATRPWKDEPSDSKQNVAGLSMYPPALAEKILGKSSPPQGSSSPVVVNPETKRPNGVGPKISQAVVDLDMLQRRHRIEESQHFIHQVREELGDLRHALKSLVRLSYQAAAESIQTLATRTAATEKELGSTYVALANTKAMCADMSFHAMKGMHECKDGDFTRLPN